MRSRAPDRALPGRFLLRLARLFASSMAYERVFVPLLADFQFEYAGAATPLARLRARLRWTLAFGQALGLAAASATLAHLRCNAWGTTNEEREVARRLVARGTTATILCTLVFVLTPYVLHRRPRLGASGLALSVELALSLPAVLCLAIPVGVLFGVVHSTAGRPRDQLRWRPLLSVAGIACLVTFTLAAWITPNANHAFRESVVEHLQATAPELAARFGPRASGERGDREMSMADLRAKAAYFRSEGMRLSGGRLDLEWHKQLRLAAGRLDLEWHKKLAFGASCLALALAGVAIARRSPAHAWRWSACLIVLLGFYWLLRLGEQAADVGAIAPALAMWGPCVAVAALGLGALSSRPRTPAQ